jgi:site-specific DNA-cytosine methylase
MGNYKVLGVNAGMGVSLFPFKENLIGNIEPRQIFHTPNNIQWVNNFGDIPLSKEFTKQFEKPDVIISSPDCGSGSVLRYSRAKKLGDHKKNLSLLMFFRSIKVYKPKFFYFENLSGLYKSFPRADFHKLCKMYRLIEHHSSVKNWGNSQLHRKRLVIIGVRKDLSKEIDKYFRLPNYGDYTKTCWELYGDLDTYADLPENIRIGHVREPMSEMTTIYAGRKLSNLEIRNIWNNELKNGRRWSLCPGKKFQTAPGVYRNRKNDYPATARKANRQYDHRGRMLTPRQLARIQGVPDEFVIHLDLNKLKYWINKGRAAVTKTPPYEISVWFKRKLEKSAFLWQ